MWTSRARATTSFRRFRPAQLPLSATHMRIADIELDARHIAQVVGAAVEDLACTVLQARIERLRAFAARNSGARPDWGILFNPQLHSIAVLPRTSVDFPQRRLDSLRHPHHRASLPHHEYVPHQNQRRNYERHKPILCGGPLRVGLMENRLPEPRRLHPSSLFLSVNTVLFAVPKEILG